MVLVNNLIHIYGFRYVEEFYQATVQKMLRIFPLGSEALKIAPAANPRDREKFSTEDVRKLALSFTFSSDIANQIAHGWLDYTFEEILEQAKSHSGLTRKS